MPLNLLSVVARLLLQTIRSLHTPVVTARASYASSEYPIIMHVHFLRKGLLLIAYVIASVDVVNMLGQLPTSTPGTYADANGPSGATDPMKEAAIWQVDNLTGALNVRIPFPTVPQGGRGPKIPFALIYNSSATATLQLSDIVANGTIFEYKWAAGNVSGTQPSAPVGPWTMTGPYENVEGTFIPDNTPVYGEDVSMIGISIGPYWRRWRPAQWLTAATDRELLSLQNSEAQGEVSIWPKRTKLRCSKYLNNLIEQDHRGVKSRTQSMLGFKTFQSAAITIAGGRIVAVHQL